MPPTPRTYNEIHEGDSLPPAQRLPTHRKILMFIGASWQWVPQFYEQETADRMGLEGPIVPGPVRIAYLEQFIRRWLGGAGTFQRIHVSHRRPDYHDRQITIGGTVTRKYKEHGHKLVDFELWIDNPQGERSVRGNATVAFD